MRRCPRCAREEHLIQGICTWCGYPSLREDRSHPPDHSHSPGPGLSGAQWTRARASEPFSSGVTWEQMLSPAQSRSGPLPERNIPAEPLLVSGQVLRGDLVGDGRYRLLDPIHMPANQNQQRIAWHALDILVDHRRVVIYEISPPEHLSTNQAAAPWLVSSIVARFKALEEHPGSPKVIESFHEKGRDFLVLLYPEGVTLSVLLKRQGGALPEEQVASYGYQLCGLLAFLADQRPALVHGAITPETILLSHDLQQVTLLHLPLFPLVHSAPPGEEHGAAGYAAPEQVRDGVVTPMSDLYSVAVCMHHAMTGYDPHTRLALFHPPVRRLNPAITPQMELILTRQLSLSSSQRYHHPDEMQRALATLLESYPEPLSGEHTARPVNPLNLDISQLRENSKSALLLNMGVFAAVCALILMGLILFFLRA